MERAKELQKESIENRRHLHQYPELGYDLVETTRFVKEKLLQYGYDADELESPIENSIVIKLGKPGKTIMLRADMDALPIQEQTGLEYSSKIPNRMHACGHDIHTATLLTAARILKENEDKLNGTVKLLFQPAEELLNGAEKMVDAGVLENPKVDFAMAVHDWPTAPKGFGFFSGVSMAGALNFKITIDGISTHGATPSLGIDPVFIGTFIINALQAITTREVDFKKGASITLGKFDGNGAMNLIPDQTVIEGTARSFDIETLEYMKKRIPEIVIGIAKVFKATAKIEWIADCPPLVNDEEMTAKVKNHAKNVLKNEYEVYDMTIQNGSEDFAFISQKVPSVYFIMQMKDSEEYKYNLHNSKVVMNEEMMAPTAAIFVETAIAYLNGDL